MKYLLFKILAITIPILLGIHTLSYAQINLSAGLIAHYPFNGNASDLSGNGNTGVIINVLTLTGNRFLQNNSSYQFKQVSSQNTTDGYISTNTILGNIGTGDFSYSIWYNTNDKGNSKLQYLFSKRTSSQGNSIEFVFYDQTLILSTSAIGINIQTSILGINNNEWHFAVATRENGLIKLYHDSKLVTVATNVNNINNNAVFKIGASSVGNNIPFGFFSGKLDEARVYNRAINQSEVTALYTEYCDTHFAQNPIISYTNGGISVNTYGGANYQWAVNSSIQPTQTLAGFSGSLTNGLYSVTVTNAACKAFASYQLNQYRVGTIVPQNDCSTLPFLVPIETPSTVSSGIIGMDIEMSFNPAVMTPTGIAYLGGVVTNTGTGLVDLSTMGNVLHLNISYDGAGEFSGAGLIVAPEFTLVQPATVGLYTVGGGNVKESYLISERDVELNASTLSIVHYYPTLTGKAFFWGNATTPIINNSNPAAGTFVAQSLVNCVGTGKTSGTDANGTFNVEMGDFGFGVSASRDIPNTTPVVAHLNANDNVLVTRIRNGQIANPTIQQLIAADVNGSGAITSGDRTLLRRRTLMQITSFPNNVPDWKFYNATLTFSGFNRNSVPSVLTCIPVSSYLENGCVKVNNISLTGILIGDVDGSYNTTIGGANLRTEGVTHTEVDYANATTNANGITSIPVKVYHDSAVEGFDITFDFDSTKYKVESVTINEAINSNNTDPVGFNVPWGGYLIATVDNELGMNINPYLLSINISKLSSDFVANDLGTPKSYINGKAARTEIVSETTSTVKSDNNKVFSIYPNPSTGSFIIETSNSGQKIEVSDILGHIIYTDIISSTEKNEISIDRKGIFFIKVGIKVQKMIIK